MEAESVRASKSIPSDMREPSRSLDRDAIIEACYDLLSSGHPLSEVLGTAKRLASLKVSTSELCGRPGTAQSSQIPEDNALFHWGDAQVTEEHIEPRVVSLSGTPALRIRA